MAAVAGTSTPSPGAATSPAPTRTQFENPDTTDLDEAAARWDRFADESEAAWTAHRRGIDSPGGTVWKGETRDAAFHQVSTDMAVVARQCDIAREAAAIARDASDTRWRLARKVVDAILDAEDDGFHVDEDLTVRDTGFDPDNAAARKTAAAEHADYIDRQVQQYLDAETSTAERLQAKAVELAEPRFEGEGRDATVQLVDNRIKLDPQAPPTPNPKDPNPNHPGRSRDGTYGPGNSGSGKAAEKAALDAREAETGIPIIRDQVKATHPGVIKDGKPQARFYDGLEPTGNPDEYIGIEAKTEGTNLTPDQRRFDQAVSPERPATATLNGRAIKIVDAQTINPPPGWEPPPATPTPGAGLSPGAPGGAGLPVAGTGNSASPPGIEAGGSATGVAGGDARDNGLPVLTPEQRKHWEEMGPPFSILAPYAPSDPNDPGNQA